MHFHYDGAVLAIHKTSITMKTLTVLLFSLLTCLPLCAGNVQVTPAPAGAELLSDYTVLVRQDNHWLKVPTYKWRADSVAAGRHQAVPVSVAMLDFTETAEIAVVCHREPIQHYAIRPLSYQIPNRQQGDTIFFTLDRPRYLSIEINGHRFGNLHLFADNPLPKMKRKRNVVYFGPGMHKLQGDTLWAKSGQTIFIDQGAVLKGTIMVKHCHDVRIMGHGIVNPGARQGIVVNRSKRVLVDGLFTTQIPVGTCDSVTVRNAKVMSWYGWGDGMNVFASSHVSYDHVFCRTSDDCSTIYCTRLGNVGSCHNIRVNDAVYWADVAHPIMIGLHGDIDKNEEISDVVYENVDILRHNEYQLDYQGCIGINNGDNILCRDLTFRNFHIEDIENGMLFNFRVCYNKKYCHAPGRGIKNVLLDNISYQGRTPNISLILGYNENRKVNGIRFQNFNINGKLITDDMPGKPKWYKTADMARIFVGEHAEDLSFTRTNN